MMILHHGWRSSASRRVRLCLEEKGLLYQGHLVDMAKMEHHSPEYLKINPLGVIPTLIHDGRPMHESGTICEYLDETFPDPPLRPATAYERAEMRNWIRHIDDEMPRHPRVNQWWSTIQARPAFARANIGPFLDS